MSTTQAGRRAEAFVAEKLVDDGYGIITVNWRTRYCEIDIVASRSRIVYFIEVKFRSRTGQGGGMDYITAVKLRQLKYAAELWCKENDWAGDYRICAAAVSPGAQGLVMDELLEIDY